MAPAVDSRATRAPSSRRRGLAIACLAALVAALRIAGAQERASDKAGEEKQQEKPPVSLRLVQQGERSYAMTRLDVAIEWRREAPAAGQLVLEIFDDRRRVLELRSRELPLAPGPNRFSIHVPPLRRSDPTGLLTVRPRLLAAGEVYHLQSHVLSVPLREERRLLVAGVGPEVGEARARFDELRASLRIERDLELDEDDATAIQTQLLLLKPSELPDSPLELCRFDVLCLAEEGFLLLEEPQLAAVAAWVEGGGALWLALDGGLKDRHHAFLVRLAQRAGAAGALAPAGSRVERPGAAGGGPLHLSPGVGRAVIDLEPRAMPASLEQPPWVQARRFLWGSRDSPERLARLSRGQGTKMLAEMGLEPPDPPVVDPLTEILLPSSVQLVPFAALASILLGFLILIGPVDYFLLGALRRRRLTWVTFPLASGAATLLVTLLSQRYLGEQSHERSLVVIDVAADGHPVRENRFTLRFPAASQKAEIEASQELLVPLGQAEYPGGVPAPTGSYPERCSFAQELRQWQPVLHRRLRFEPGVEGPALGWAAIEEPARAWFAQGSGDPEFLTQLLGESRLPELEVFLIHGDACLRRSPGGAGYQPVRFTATAPALLRVLQLLSVADGSGWRGFVARASPSGDVALEDVPLVRRAPRGQEGLIIVAYRRGSDIVCLRRPYHGRI